MGVTLTVILGTEGQDLFTLLRITDSSTNGPYTLGWNPEIDACAEIEISAVGGDHARIAQDHEQSLP